MPYKDPEKEKAWREAHKEERRTYNKAWREAHHKEVYEYQKVYHKANPEKHKKHQKAYRKKHTTRLAAKQKVWATANPQRLKLRLANWYQANREKVLAQSKVYRNSHRKQTKASYKAWYKLHYNKVLENCRKRRALKHKAPYEIINEKEVCLRDGWICQHCKKKIDKDLKWPHLMSASLDHIIPLSKGGHHTYKNVQLTHLQCNISKNINILPQGEQLRLF